MMNADSRTTISLGDAMRAANPQLSFPDSMLHMKSSPSTLALGNVVSADLNEDGSIVRTPAVSWT